MEELRATLFFDDTPELQEGGALLPTGDHTLEVIAVKSGTAKTGRGRLGLQVKVVGGDADGRKGWDNWNLPDPEKDKKDGRIFKFWKHVAKVCPEAVKNNGNGQQGLFAEALIGLQYKTNITHEEFGGKKVTRCNFPYPVAMVRKAQTRPEFNTP